MTYQAPTVDASGLHTPTYQEIEDQLVASARSVFGNDIYLGFDSQDFQDIAARARAIYDAMQALQLGNSQRGPASAIGVGLDGVVQINGLTRKTPSSSTAQVALTGAAFTVISSGIVSDVSGNKWDLPASVLIGTSGTVTVTATCQVVGPISAQIGQINRIETPTFGWSSVTNPAVASVGQPVETDSQLRARQAVSVSNPSQALTSGILGAVLAVQNVISAQLYENDTNTTLSYAPGSAVYNPGGYPAHSITVVAQGGADADVANAIARRKTPGCFTAGTVSVTTTDSIGISTVIRFYRPLTATIKVALTIKALAGYTSAIGDAIKAAIVAYLVSLGPGRAVYLSELWSAALTTSPDLVPYFSLRALTAAIGGGMQSTNDILLAFNYQAFAATGDITLTVT